MIQKTSPPPTLCPIALTFYNVFSQKSPKCSRKLGAVNNNLICVPSAAGIHTLLCNVDVKIALLCTVHMTQWNIKGGSGFHTTNTLATEQSGPESGRLQHLIGDAGEGLQTLCEGHQWAARTYCRRVGWTRSAHHRYRSQTVSLCLSQSCWWTFRAETVIYCITLVVRTL